MEAISNNLLDLSNEMEAFQKVLDALVLTEKISNEDRERVLSALSDQLAIRPGLFLVRSGIISERDLVSSQSDVFDIATIKDEEFPEFPISDLEISTKYLLSASILPITTNGDVLVMAMADVTDNTAVHAVELATNKKVVPRLATYTQIENAINQLYGNGQSSFAGIVDEIEEHDATEETDTIEKLKTLAGEAPIVRLVNLIIHQAVEQRASDIHIEPFEHRLKVRYRIDGVLHDAESPPTRSTAAVISRFKIMAKMNIAERRLPQDGRIQIRHQGKLIDLRVSTVPILHGESLVLRILDKQRVQLDLDKLGFAEANRKQLLDILNLPHGIILVTGPTGSGKTTTLYAALQHLNTPEKKILTVEDPVEYQLDGINQIQVKPQIGLTFADALRSIVRQDPDVIMIGEMRDLETARIAVQSALTGHLVLSTLHTNDAGSSITRLLDMGVEDYLLTSTLNAIMAQRLVRTLCNQCKSSYTPAPELLNELMLQNDSGLDTPALYNAIGCKHCANTGFYGRTVILELLCLSESIRRLILAHADGTEIQNAAIESGMLTMKQDGIRKAVQGITTIEEVIRVTQDA